MPPNICIPASHLNNNFAHYKTLVLLSFLQHFEDINSLLSHIWCCCWLYIWSYKVCKYNHTKSDYNLIFLLLLGNVFFYFWNLSEFSLFLYILYCHCGMFLCEVTSPLPHTVSCQFKIFCDSVDANFHFYFNPSSLSNCHLSSFSNAFWENSSLQYFSLLKCSLAVSIPIYSPSTEFFISTIIFRYPIFPTGFSSYLLLLYFFQYSPLSLRIFTMLNF